MSEQEDVELFDKVVEFFTPWIEEKEEKAVIRILQSNVIIASYFYPSLVVIFYDNNILVEFFVKDGQFESAVVLVEDDKRVRCVYFEERFVYNTDKIWDLL